MKTKNPILGITILFVLSIIFCASYYPDGLTPEEFRGKLIYTKGINESGEPIIAQLSGASFDAKILPCINCHGKKGQGNPEGGVIPSKIDWSILTKPYTIEFKNGRKRKAYNSSTLQKAIVEGVDPNGNTLDEVMPKYSLSDQDAADLISYLKVIKGDAIEGVTNTTIQIGVILPNSNQPNGRSEAIVKTINAYLDLVNSGGGLYGRTFVLKPLLLDIESDKMELEVIDYLSKNDLFSLIASDLAPLNAQALLAIQNLEIPIIGAISGSTKKEDYFKNNFYYLLPSYLDQINNLIYFSKNNLNASNENIIIIYDDSSSAQTSVLETITKKSKYKTLKIGATKTDQITQIRQLKKDGIQHCILLNNSSNCSFFIKNIQEENFYPNLLLSGQNANPNWLGNSIKMDRKIYLSYPNWLTERNEKAMDEYYYMASTYGLNSNFLNAQLRSLTATILFTETLKHTEKDLSRESLISVLHELRDFENGYMSPLSFGPNKRIGSEKVYIVTADLKNKKFQLVD